MRCVLLEVFILLTISFTVNSQELELLGPLKAFLGDTLQLVCVSSSGGAFRITIGEGTTPVTDRISTGFQNDTVKEFFLNDTIKDDNGRALVCAASETLSDPVTVSIIYFESFSLTPSDDFVEETLTLAEDTNDFEVIRYTFNANPQPTISLTRTDGIPVNNERLQRSDDAVRINGLSRDDAGTYNLTFVHPAANEVIFFEFTLEVEYGPEISAEITGANTQCSADSLNYDCTTILGVDVTITCSVSANPPATLEVVIVDRDNVQVFDDSSTQARIVIDDLVMENFEAYQCIANNTVVGNEVQRTTNITLLLFVPTTMSTADFATTDSAGMISPLRSLTIATFLAVLAFFSLL